MEEPCCRAAACAGIGCVSGEQILLVKEESLNKRFY